jgi:hypothetical protein
MVSSLKNLQEKRKRTLNNCKGPNCDALTDIIYVVRGTAIGGVLILKLW